MVKDDGADIGELAAVWAVLNVVEAGSAEDDCEIVEIRRGFNQLLAEQELAPVDLFEYIAQSFEQGDWQALGLAHVDPEVEEALMGRANDGDRYVIPNPQGGGWDGVKEDHEGASAGTGTKADAVTRARDIVRNQGGGEICIANQEVRHIDSDTVSRPRHRESPRDRK